MPKLLLLRAFFETSNGGYYSPIHDNGCATLLPILDNREWYRVIPPHLLANNIVDTCTGCRLSAYYAVEYGVQPLVHRDPRLDLGFYTGYYAPGGRLPKSSDKRLVEGDYLLFMAGLARYPEGFWGARRRLNEIKRIFQRLVHDGKTGIFIVGGLRVVEVVDVSVTGWSRVLEEYPFLAESPHYYRFNDNPVAVIGEPLQITPIKIADSRGKPTMELIKIVGREHALKIARNKYRKSRVVVVKGDVEDQLVNLI